MSNTGLFTNGGYSQEINQLYYSSITRIPGSEHTQSTTYCFLGKANPWPNDTNPPVPEITEKYLKNVYNNMFVMKRVLPTDMRALTDRIDWSAGQVYDYYRDDINMMERSNGSLVNAFYVKNKYDQVFKCLYNGSNTSYPNGIVSTNEPYFKPGNFGTNNVFQDVDGYKWKYLYTIDAGSKRTFMDSYWMPVPVGSNTPNPISNDAGYGNIDVINVTNGGSHYDPANSTINIKATSFLLVFAQ